MISFPLAGYFLGGHLSKNEDTTNFPNNDIPEILCRYETLFTNVLDVLGIKKEQLKGRSEFNLIPEMPQTWKVAL